MKNETGARLIEELAEILERERSALLSGDLQAVSRIVDRKEDLVRCLKDVPDQDAGDLDRINSGLTRNESLLAGAREGILAAAGRMRELRRARRGLETYDKSGRKNRVATPAATGLEKRA